MIVRPLITGFMGFFKLGPPQELDRPWMPPKPILAQVLEAAKDSTSSKD